MLLPTFFVIGAGKSGTTALHHYLDLHPEIEMTRKKEVHFFLGDRWRERVESYREHFAGGTAQRGDASPGYTVYPRHADTPERMRELVPDARLVYIVRDPVDRAVAQYAQHVIMHEEKRSPEEALDPADEGNDYLCISSYASQVENYLRVFEPDRLLVLDQRDLRERRRETLQRVFGFLGVDHRFWADEFEAMHNVRGEDNVQLPPAVQRLQTASSRSALRRAVPQPVRSGVRRLLNRRLGTNVAPEIPGELRERVARRLAPEAERFRGLTGLEVSHWSV